mmetsp:Transcript_10052/g.35207  ORF Transcript_10052/g.35207 Transcript_10052/m.35207 type:complete len:325 (+) Transcript_10052:62-1036(+)
MSERRRVDAPGGGVAMAAARAGNRAAAVGSSRARPGLPRIRTRHGDEGRRWRDRHCCSGVRGAGYRCGGGGGGGGGFGGGGDGTLRARNMLRSRAAGMCECEDGYSTPDGSARCSAPPCQRRLSAARLAGGSSRARRSRCTRAMATCLATRPADRGRGVPPVALEPPRGASGDDDHERAVLDQRRALRACGVHGRQHEDVVWEYTADPTRTRRVEDGAPLRSAPSPRCRLRRAGVQCHPDCDEHRLRPEHRQTVSRWWTCCEGEKCPSNDRASIERIAAAYVRSASSASDSSSEATNVGDSPTKSPSSTRSPGPAAATVFHVGR